MKDKLLYTNNISLKEDQSDLIQSVRVSNKILSNCFKNIKYDFGDEYLESIIKKYDTNVNHSNSLVFIGETIFNKWDIPIEACLYYGESIFIFKYKVFINIKYEQLNFKLEINLTHGIKRLNDKIGYHLNKHFDYVALKFENKLLTDESKSLMYYGINEGSTLHVCDFKIKHWAITKGNFNLISSEDFIIGQQFTDLSQIPKTIEWSKNAPEWSTAKMGLCLEGECTNKQCKAYKKMVIINMGVPVIFKLGLPTAKQPTNCPICNSFVKPVTCAFNNCQYRYIAIKETKNGLEKIKSDWKNVDNKYHYFDENKQVDYTSLVIETKSSLLKESITEKFGCSSCFQKFHQKDLSTHGSKENFLHELNIEQYGYHEQCLSEWFIVKEEKFQKCF